LRNTQPETAVCQQEFEGLPPFDDG